MSSTNGPSQLLRGFEVLTSQDSCNFLSFPPIVGELTAQQQLALGEVELLRGLVNGDPTLAITSIKGTTANKDVESVKVANPSDELFSDIMVNKNSVEPDIAMSLLYEVATSADSSVDILISHALPTAVKETCSLDKDSTPLFAANIDIEHIDGLLDGTSYKTITADKTGVLNTNTKSHTILLDKNDAEVTLFKYRNSVKGSVTEEGIKGEFDNTFNTGSAFLTNATIARDSANNQLTAGAGFSDYFTDKLEKTQVDGTPIFGALKFVQGSSSVASVANNTDSDSTMASLVGTTLSAPVAPSDEAAFKALFSDTSSISDGYTVSLTLGAEETGGYSIATTEDKNKMSVITYGDDNLQVTTDDKVEMFTVDDSAITNNLPYMNAMKAIKNADGSFPAHEIYVKNGDFKISDATNSSLFTVLDGVEKLQVKTVDGINDLTAKGEIKVQQSNNILGDAAARWTKEVVTLDNVKSLTVTYPDETGEVGVLSDALKNNSYVESEVTAFSKSTLDGDGDAAGVWNTAGKDIAVKDNSVLVFQDSTASNNDVVTDFEAVGLNGLMEDNTKFALVQVSQTMVYSGDMVEAVHDAANAPLNVVSNVSLSDIDLTSLGKNDLRVAVYGRNVSELPGFSLEFGGDAGASLRTAANSGLVIGRDDSFETVNKGVLTASPESADSSWGPIIPVDAVKTTIVNMAIEYKVDQSNTNTFNIQISSGGSSINTVVEGSDIQIVGEVVEFPSPAIETTTLTQGIVKKYTEIKSFTAAIKLKVGAYSNLWFVRPVTQRTVTWKLFDSADKQLPDYYLKRIKDFEGKCPYLTTKKFVKDGNEVSKLTSYWNFTIADLFVAKAEVQYKDTVGGVWTSFESVGRKDLDLVFDTQTVLKFKPSSITATANIIIDALDKDLTFGVVPTALLSVVNPVLYMIELNTSSGTATFDASGYMYNIADHAQWLKTFSPYSSGALFLVDGLNNKVGTALTLTTDVVYGALVNPSVPRQVTVNIYNPAKTLIASFKSNQMIIDSFNILSSKAGPIVRHKYIVAKSEPSPSVKEYAVEYLPSVRRTGSSVVDGEEYYCKLRYGASYDGVLVNLAKAVLPTSKSTFKLRGDKVCINLLTNAFDNSYGGRYSVYEEIMPSLTGVPKPTNSLIHRNIAPKQFRGYKDSAAVIDVIRTVTTAKLVIGGVYQDDMNFHSDSNTSGVWAKRGQLSPAADPYRALESLDIYKPSVSDNISEMANLFDQSRVANSAIGGIGLKLFTDYSMFPTAITSLHKIPILLTAADYKLTVGPATTTGNLFEVVLKEFANKSLVARRIKVYAEEKIEFTYNFGTMTIYQSPTYLGSPSGFTWTALQSDVSDLTLRNAGVVAGFYKFTRSKTFVDAYTKYAVLPPPIAKVTANNIESVGVSRYVDIALGTNAHYPFTGVTKINNLKLSFATDLTYTDLQSTQPVFKFTMPTDIIKMSMSVGDADASSSQLVFEGPASALSDVVPSTYWKVSDFEGSFANKVWNIKFGQPGYSIGTPVTALMSIPASIRGQKNISITGIPSFAVPSSKRLALRPLQGVKSIFYEIDPVYEPDSLNFTVTFKKLSTVSEGVGERSDDINFGDSVSVASLKYQTYNPLIVKVESYTITGTISDVLSDTPRNVVTLFREAAAVILANKSSIPWTNPVSISAPFKRSPVTLAPLTKAGHKQLLEWLYVSAATPLKIFAFNRPKMYRVIRADGLPLVSISPDGIFDKFSANELSLIGTF